MGKLQDQITTGKKVNRPSDDPVVAMKGIGYRTALDKVGQYQRNIGEVNSILDSSDDALDQVGSALHRAKELVVQASTGTTSVEDRKAIESELNQLRQHIQNLANTKVGDKHVFSGTKTTTPLYDNGYPANDAAFKNSVEIEVFDGITMKANTNAIDLFKDIDQMFADINAAAAAGAPSEDYTKFMTTIENNVNSLLTTRADIGARQNRVELMDNRLQAQEVVATKQMSNNEDIDYEQVITQMITQESVHRAALSVGARIIQPTLTDFLR